MRAVPAPCNYFARLRSLRNATKVGSELFLVNTRRLGVWCGPLHVLIERALSSMKRDLPRPLDPLSVEFLFEKRLPGLISRRKVQHGPYQLCIVHVKPFVRWAQANAVKLCYTSRDWQREQARRVYQAQHQDDGFNDDCAIALREELERQLQQQLVDQLTRLLQRERDEELSSQLARMRQGTRIVPVKPAMRGPSALETIESAHGNPFHQF